jgi:ABC-type antimicrobial peptide transport system permease subunit
MTVLPGWSYLLLLAGLLLGLYGLARAGRVPLLYNARNLLVRWRASLVTALAFTLVIALFIVMLAFVRGFLRMTEGTGHPANVMVLSRGSTDELTSSITAQEAGADVALHPGVLRDEQGRPLCSREVYVVVNQRLTDGPGGKVKRRLVQVRGIEDPLIAARVHGVARLRAGTWFSTGGVRDLTAKGTSGPRKYAIEAVVGSGFARQWGVGVGDLFEVGPRTWVVAGVLPESGSTFDSELWAKHQQVGAAFGKEHSFTSLLLRTRDAESAKEVAEDLNHHFKKASFHVLPETSYYAGLARTSQGFVSAVYVLAVVLAVGGVLGVMNTMFASVTQRRKDIAMLRVVGFARWQVLLSFLIESLLLALAGGALGCALGGLAHGWSASSLIENRNMTFTLQVDAQTLVIALAFTLTMGAAGGLLPALSTVRVRPLETLRAG